MSIVRSVSGHVSPLPVVSDRRPFAPSALPEFIARMGVSDFRSSPPSSSLFRLVRRCAVLPAPTIGSPWLPRTLVVRLDAVFDPGVAPRACQCARDAVACWSGETIGQHTNASISGLNYLQGQHYLFPLHLASFLCLRIKHPVTGLPARLNTRPVASGYLGGIRTRQTTRHCQAATSGASGWMLPAGAVAGWGLHPLKSAAFSRRTPTGDIRRRRENIPESSHPLAVMKLRREAWYGWNYYGRRGDQ